MSVQPISTLEKHLADKLLYSFLGPLNMFAFDLNLGTTTEQRLSITKAFIEKHLSKDKQPVVVDLQDERILELFDEAMKNMARDTVQRSIEHNRLVESCMDSSISLILLLDSLKPKTWADYARERIQRVGKTVSKTINRSSILKRGLDAAHYGLSRIGVISEKQSTDQETGVVLIEEDDDWREVETNDSYNKRVFLILEKWLENPSLLLEIEPTKENISYLRNDLLPKARSIAKQPQ